MSKRDRSIREWEKRNWKVVKVEKKTDPLWTIYTRKIASTNFLEYKIEGTIAASPKASILAFKQDIYNLTNGQKSKKYPHYEIINESGDSLLTYVIHKEPFPLKNTEMSVMYTFFTDSDGSTGVKWKEDWDANPIEPSKKVSRVKSFRGSWLFTPKTDNITSAVTSVNFDPKRMPLWLVEPMVFKFLKNGLKNIKELTSK
ncbi:MAG: hypothetical protein AB8B74_12370 [Crocinitomicaceae bacterium]